MEKFRNGSKQENVFNIAMYVLIALQCSFAFKKCTYKVITVLLFVGQWQTLKLCLPI